MEDTEGVSWRVEAVVEALLKAGLAIELDRVKTTVSPLDMSADSLAGGVNLMVLPSLVLAA